MRSRGLMARAVSLLAKRAAHQPPARGGTLKHFCGEENKTSVELEELVSPRPREGNFHFTDRDVRPVKAKGDTCGG